MVSSGEAGQKAALTASRQGSNADERGPAGSSKSLLLETTDPPPTKTRDAAEYQALLQDAGKALQEMRRRAERYREVPVEDTAMQLAKLGIDVAELSEKHAIYEKAFRDHPVSVGKAVSKKDRDEAPPAKQPGSTLVYGEIDFKSFALALDKIKNKYGLPDTRHSGPEGVLQKPGGVFYDLGSGTGKPVVAATVLHHFSKAVGIEILEGLHSCATEVLRGWESGTRDLLGWMPPTEVRFVHGDAFDLGTEDWSDADLVFANSTCFDDSLMRRMAACAEKLKAGAFVVTFTKRLPSDLFEVLEHEMHEMSWGGATVYIQQRRRDHSDL